MKTQSVEISQYSNFSVELTLALIDESHMIDADDAGLIASLTTIALNDSAKVSDTYTQIIKSFYEWEKSFVNREWYTRTGMHAFLDAYNLFARQKQDEVCGECKERSKSFMKNTLPIPYAIIGAIAMLSSGIFITMLIVGMVTGTYILNPWYNIMLAIGSIGIMTTDIMAVVDWRAKVIGIDKKTRKKEKK